MTFDFAPAAIIRAPAWPLETLDDFGGEPDAPYDIAIDRERKALWERTAGDPRFMKALLLASPSLFARVRTSPGPASPRSKPMRHLETALYRYLARAAARPTPNQLWAGVALARFGPSPRIAAAAPVVHAGPDLAPFASALDRLRRRSVYREAGKWRITPTLQRCPGGLWRFLTRSFGGEIEVRQIASSPELDEHLLRVGSADAGTLRDLSVRTNTPSDLLGRFAEIGLLVGGISLPARFTSPWEALDIAGEELLSAERTAWEHARSQLAELSASLAANFEVMSLDDMIGVVERTRRTMAGLFAALSVDVDAPAAPFRCDLRLPFDITLGPEMRGRLTASLGAYQREWIDDLSPSSSNRRERRRAILNALANGPVPLATDLRDVPSVAAETDMWAATFTSAAEEIVLRGGRPHDPVAAAPWGSLVARIDGAGVTQVIGIDDSPIRLFARHSTLLGAGNPVETWVREMFAHIEAAYRVTIAELAIPFETNPNVLACPDVARLVVEPWGAGGVNLSGADLRAEAGAILLHTPSQPGISAVSCASAHWLGADPVGAGLVLSGFGEPMGFSSPAPSQAAPDEGEIARYAPRLSLSSGAVIRLRRTCLAGDAAATLASSPRQERYARWRQLGRELGWPERVSLSLDGGPPLVAPASSPLAIEAAFQGAWRARRIVVEEVGRASMPGPGGTYLAEIVAPFSRMPNAFASLKK